MRVNADSLLIRAAATSTSGTLNDLTTDLIMANNNNNMDTEKATSKTNGEVYSNVGDRSLKHELQMQLMAANMEGIMQMIAHRMFNFPGDRKR